MAEVTGAFTGPAGPIPVPNIEVPNFDAGVNHVTSPSSFQLNGRYENRQDTSQVLTVVATNLTGGLTNVSIDLGNGSNTITLDPNEKVLSPVVTVEGVLPAQPTEENAPGVTEPWSFELEATWA